MSGQVATPAGGVADFIGLFVATMIGTVFTHSPFFTITIFSLMHYLTIFPVHMMPLMGPLPNGVFNMSTLQTAIYGAIAGMALVWALNTPVLFPVHSTDGRLSSKRRFLPGAFILSLSIAFFVKSILIVTQYFWRFVPYLQELSVGAEIAIAVVVGLLMLALGTIVVVFTGMGKSSVLTIHYYGKTNEPGSTDGKFILSWLLFLILLLAAQSIADFASAPGEPLPVWAGVLIVAVVNALTWTAAYFIFKKHLDVESSVFSKKRSGTTWLNFVWVIGTAQISTTLIYAIFAPLVPTFGTLEYGMIGLMILVFIIAFAYSVYPIPCMLHRRKEQQEALLARTKSRSRSRKSSRK